MLMRHAETEKGYEKEDFKRLLTEIGKKKRNKQQIFFLIIEFTKY